MFKSELLRDLAPKASVAYQETKKNANAKNFSNNRECDRVRPAVRSSRLIPLRTGESPLLWTTLAQQFKDVARQWLIERAENAGVPTELVRKYEAEDVQGQLMELAFETEDINIEYPSYYTQAFHGYDDGNLNWQCAMEERPRAYPCA